jgi:hypothetical protein
MEEQQGNGIYIRILRTLVPRIVRRDKHMRTFRRVYKPRLVSLSCTQNPNLWSLLVTSEVGALVSYKVGCNAGGNTFPRYYEGGSTGCRCNYVGTFLCQDQEYREYCRCQPCVTSPRLFTYYELTHNYIQHSQNRRLLPKSQLSTRRMRILA